jgi:glycosyltransferase involved in cell wall biosynthesis
MIVPAEALATRPYSPPHLVPRAELPDATAPRVATAVSIVIPAYNEEAAIRPQIEAIQAVMDRGARPYELIVVDDGSTDGTADAARRAGVRLLRLPENRGYGAALKAGIAAAQHECVVITDADGTYPPEAIPPMLALAADYDMVVGARVGRGLHIPWARRPAKWFLGQVASALVGQRIPDLNSGLRILKKSLVQRYEHLLASGFSFTTTSTLAHLCNHHSVHYFPIDYHARVGTSKIRPSHAPRFLLLILRTVLYFNPLRVFLPLGALLFLSGLARLLYDVSIWKLSESGPLTLLAGLLVWAVGFHADLMARMGMAPRPR